LPDNTRNAILIILMTTENNNSLLFRLEKVTFSVDDKRILSELDISIFRGKITLITGPSGSGKSTLLKLLGSLISATSGNLQYQNQSIQGFNPIEYRSKVILIGQKPFLVNGSVRDNMLIPFELKVNKDKHPIGDEFKIYLNRFGLSDEYLNMDAAKLSGGEGQRVALARGLALQPETLLLDEPTSALDLASESKVVQYLNGIKADTSIVIVTHSPSYLKVANQVIVLKEGNVAICKDRMTSVEFEECLEKEE
jgi:UDP-glucose/iron transport system ATP-binding protein